MLGESSRQSARAATWRHASDTVCCCCCCCCCKAPPPSPSNSAGSCSCAGLATVGRGSCCWAWPPLGAAAPLAAPSPSKSWPARCTAAICSRFGCCCCCAGGCSGGLRADCSSSPASGGRQAARQDARGGRGGEGARGAECNWACQPLSGTAADLASCSGPHPDREEWQRPAKTAAG